MIRDKKHAIESIIKYFPGGGEIYEGSSWGCLSLEFWRGLIKQDPFSDRRLEGIKKKKDEAIEDSEMPYILHEIAHDHVDEDDSDKAKWLVREANSNFYIVQALDDYLVELKDDKKNGLNPEPFYIFEIIGKAQYKCNRDLLSEALVDIMKH